MDESPTTNQAEPTVVPTQRLRAAIEPKAGQRNGPRAVCWRLQRGPTAQWIAVFFLLNLRHLPVYVLPLLTGMLIDRIDPANPGKVLEVLPWAMAAAFALCMGNIFATTASNVIRQRISRTLTAGLRRALARRLNRLAFAYHDQSQSGEVQNKFLLDMQRLEAVQMFFTESMMLYGSAILVMLVIVACKMPLFLVVIASVVPLNMIVARALRGRLRATQSAYRVAENEFISQLNETISGVRLNRAHATEDLAEERLGRAAGEVAERGLHLDFISSLFGSGNWAVSSFLHMVVVGLGVWLAVSGPAHTTFLGFAIDIPRLSVGDLTILVSYYAIVAAAMSHILGSIPALAAARDAVNSLADLWDEDQEEEADNGKRTLPRIAGEIEMRRVTFTYRPETGGRNLNGLDLHIPAGTSLALVGASGSGKSTIASLILGFYQPQEGSVLIDGQDLRQLDRRSVRRQIGVVSQDVVLFRDSILDNIAWGERKPDRARAREAARRANALEFIEAMPGGFDHELGDRGIGLSGGQRQRLAIARALYRDPRILVLDEATSALDPESERLVQKALEELMRGRTTVIIAHRLSTVRSANRIAVLDHGQVIEAGTYDELMEKNGAFKRLATGQLA